MSFKFQLPPITQESGIDKLRSYLMQMTEQLEYALNNIETSNFTLETQNEVIKNPEQKTENDISHAVDVLKDMIVKNAEVIESHMDEISQELHGDYTALSSEFGEYKQESTAQITANAENITTNYTQIQAIQGDVTNLQTDKADGSDLISLADAVGTNASWIRETNFYIKTGLLYYEGLDAINGIALGQIQTETVGGETVMKRQGFYSVFTPTELAFYIGANKVAYVSNDKLYITQADITDKMDLGRYVWSDEGNLGLTLKWKG